MKKYVSYFRDPAKDREWFEQWARKVMSMTGREFQKETHATQLGKTVVWSYGADRTELPVLVIFPGFRTTPLFWDLDKGLDELIPYCRIYLVETNGQPNSSDGNSPAIKSDGYGLWASEVLDQLGVEQCFIAGASCGGSVCMKLCAVAPEKIHAAFLLNPGCLQSFSMTWKNLYLNLLPVFSPKRKNISKFLDGAVFHKPHHQLTPEFEKVALDYLEFALLRFKDNTQKPYYMNKELDQVTTEVHLLLGTSDLLFPYEKSASNAKKHLKNLKATHLMPNIGHGIETDRGALKIVGETIRDFNY